MKPFPEGKRLKRCGRVDSAHQYAATNRLTWKGYKVGGKVQFAQRFATTNNPVPMV